MKRGRKEVRRSGESGCAWVGLVREEDNGEKKSCLEEVRGGGGEEGGGSWPHPLSGMSTHQYW